LYQVVSRPSGAWPASVEARAPLAVGPSPKISRGLPAKEPREFDLVLDVKCDGWFGLVHALGDTPLRATVVFSSVAGRFGNAGQTDYAAANDLLCKVTSSLRRTWPGTRAIALDADFRTAGFETLP